MLFRSPRGPIEAVRRLGFELGREKLGLVGESGSGKSTVGRAILRITPASAKITAKTLALGAEELLAASPARMREIRGRHISMVLQDPTYSLNPVVRVGAQVAESFLVHRKASRTEARERALDMFAQVRIDRKSTRLNSSHIQKSRMPSSA